MSLSTTDDPLADATATGGEEDPSPVLDVEDCSAVADADEAVAASGVTFEVEEGDDNNNNKSGNDDTNPRHFITWESRGTSYQFPEHPIRNCVWIILVLKAVQQGVHFGFLFMNPGFLTGAYNPDWSPGFSSSKANTFISNTQALTNTLPFLVALAADFLLGDYWVIMILVIVFLLPGILIITLCAWPYQLGDTFPLHLYRIGFQILVLIGDGGLDVIIDIFGAKQYHPIVHARQLDTYFVWSTVATGAGTSMATLVYAMIANVNITASFGLMTITMFIAAVLFVYGSMRYIVRRNKMKDNVLTAWAMLNAAFCWKRTEQGQVVACPPGFNKVKKSRGGGVRDDLVSAARRLALVVPVQGLFVPVNIAAFQTPNTLIPMSYAMKHPTLWSGANMVFVHSIHIVLFGVICNNFFYPYLEKRNIRLSTAHRVCIGSCFQALMYLVMLGVDQRLRKVYEQTGEMISIGWQYFPYAIGGMGWVFTMAPQDAITYVVAPSEWKVLGNAINKFMQSGLSAVIAAALYKKNAAWYKPSNGQDNINGIVNYTSAESNKMMWIWFGFALLQAVILTLPPVNRWYKKIEKYCEARSA